ncbi:MAG: AraC family transcriptional regulator [Spirochaetaceae bacterium]
MLKKIKDFILLRTFFSKLMLSFILIIFIVSAANYATYQIYKFKIKSEMEKTATELLVNVSSRFDSIFQDIEVNLLNLYIENSLSIEFGKEKISDYQQKVITKKFQKSTLQDYDVETLLLLEETDFVLTIYGAYGKDNFFKRYYSSELYDESFWSNEMTKNFSYKYYSIKPFTDLTLFSTGKTKDILPVVFKPIGNSKFLLLSLIDFNKLASIVDDGYLENFYIISKDGRILYPRNSERSSEELIKDSIFNYSSDQSGFTYVKVYTNNYMLKRSKASGYLFIIIILASSIISFFIALGIVKNVDLKAKMISNIIKTSESQSEDTELFNLTRLGNNVRKIVLMNRNYLQDIDEKTSLLKTYLLQSAVKNIRFNIDDIKDQISINGEYLLINYKLHFTPEFTQQVYNSAGGAATFIREIIELYSKEYFTNCFAFQTEQDSIVTLVEVDSSNLDLEHILDSIIRRLDNEHEFVKFTIAYSEVHNEIKELNSIYEELQEIIKHRSISDTNQLIKYEKNRVVPTKFRLSMPQLEQLILSIKNSNLEECKHQIEVLMEYNFRIGVKEYHFQMLSYEIVNCFIKVLSSLLYFNIPQEINRAISYNRFKALYSMEQYKEVLEEMAEIVINYIQTHKTESDYIVDFVKEYLEDSYMDAVYVEMLADKLNITKTYLSTYFKSKTGSNLSDYINNFRMKKAVEILETTNIKIKDVGIKVGIHNTNTFIRNFKKITGKSPGEYRKDSYIV